MTHPALRELADMASACARECESCTEACLSEAHPERMIECIRVVRDCADACRFIAALASRSSSFAPALARDVALVCDACAAECEKFDFAHCLECAAACRRCAESCSQAAVMA